jgi:hypothetical protein
MDNLLTKTGSIREGFEYQDLYGLAVLVEWLERPSKYKWVAFEANEFGFLDDVVSCSSEDGLTLSQIKHSAVPGASREEFSLVELLDQPTGKKGSKQSLFQKWFNSWTEAKEQAKYKTVYAELLTNRSASDSLLSFAKKDKDTGFLHLDISKLQSSSGGEWAVIVSQASTKTSLIEPFLSAFALRFNHSEIDVQRAALQIRTRALGISPEGFQGLEEAARKWATRRPHDGVIKFSDVRLAAKWNVPRALNEAFALPRDFVQAGPDLVQQLVSKLGDVKGGAVVIQGSPGSGKSTFLSSIYGHLRKAGISCARHHYFIDRDDPNRIKRLQSEVASEAILSELINQLSEILPNLNPEPVQLEKILRDTASALADQGKTLVLIVDGLDEVERGMPGIELQRFIRDLPIGKGLWIVFGTRPLAEQRSAALILEMASEENRLPVPLFHLGECDKMIAANTDWLRIHEQERPNFVASFLKVTAGHPLHCRYVIEALKQKAKGSYFDENDLDRIPPFGNDLTDFYNRLWRSIDNSAKEVALLLAIASFPLSATQIVDVLISDKLPSSDLLNALEKLKPFVTDNPESMELFHTSFREFLRQTPEHVALRNVLLGRLVSWLKERSPEELRWAHLNRLLYFRGDPKPLIESVNRDWSIDAFEHARPPEQVIDQIEWATNACMEQTQFDRALLAGQLGAYIRSSWDSSEQTWDSIDVLARRLTRQTVIERRYLASEIQSRSPEVLLDMADDLFRAGDIETLNEIASELTDRFERRRWSRQRQAGDEYVATGRTLLIVAARIRSPQDGALRIFTDSDDVRVMERFLYAYIDALIDAGQATLLKQILADTNWQSVSSVVVDRLYRASLFSGRPPIVIAEPSDKLIWYRLYHQLVKASAQSLRLPETSELPITSKEWDTAEESQIETQFRRVYLESMIAGAAQKPQELLTWRDSLQKDAWAHTAFGSVAEMGFEHGSLLANKSPISREMLAKPLANVPPFSFPEHRDWWGISKAYRKALIDIVSFCANLRFGLHGSKVDREFLAGIQDVPQLKTSSSVPDVLLKVTPTALSDSSLNDFVKQEGEDWVTKMETFPERAEYYLKLATLAYRSGFEDSARALLRTGISNALGYGYHKDMAIYLNADAIEGCSKAGSEDGRTWLSRLAPIALQAGRFTDGDETRNVILRVTEACETACPDVLHSIYVDMCRREEFYWAEQVFPSLIRIANLADPFQSALGRTSIDEESRKVLETRASQGDKDAAVVLEAVRLPSSPVAMETDESESSYSTPEVSDAELSDVKPSDVSKYLSTLDPPYRQHEFIKRWFAKQVEKGDIEDSFLALRDWMREREFYLVDGDILLKMVPFAEEFGGREEGFEYLCMAATRSYAWSKWGISKETRAEIWSEVQQRYPEKWLEYIFRTCGTSMYGISLRKMMHLPASLGTEFLIQFGQVSKAESLVESDLVFIEQLMANLTIPPVSWFADSVTPLDSIVARAFWISPPVRKRAAEQLAGLLLQAETEALTLEALLQGLANEKLESRTLIWLHPIVRASRRGWKGPIDTIKRAVKTGSIASDTLLSEL